ncbi:glycosyltransferase [Candidatus Chloroploca asiatica]|uniref:Glycosyl transferase family 1 n=1 Tax=Candidatus Chloroploca asiatica TaxID=1506545 RepID=A0A2H3KXX7_9CHLR|nr:glycosyltransferase [Candidatus Chloroploca asiatica]PDV98838.1 glycosyl transferase family 1 [Candidatus Chloroploca asiatica]
MRVVILSKALVVGAYQRKLEEIARLGVTLTALVPWSWREPRVGVQRLERRFTEGYTLTGLPLALNGQHHLHFYPTLARALRRLRPEVLHIDEESFNLATFQAMRLGVALGARCCFYNYANIDRYYPPPFNLFERYNLRHASHALACNQEAAGIIRRHGYRGPLTIVPQFGVDPAIFAPRDDSFEETAPFQPSDQRPHFILGYLGRLVPEKGILDLVEALAGLPPHVCLHLIGDGSQRPAIEQRIAQLGLGKRVVLKPAINSTDVPIALQSLDALVLPSHTTPSWKEQFGRILIEAMSCGIPVVGSSSGEIPYVIGDAGLIFPEGEVPALRAILARLAANPALRTHFAERGRQRVLAHYTQAAIAQRHVEVYQSMLNHGRRG